MKFAKYRNVSRHWTTLICALTAATLPAASAFAGNYSVVSASKSAASITEGGTESLNVTVAAAKAASGLIIDLEVFNSAGTSVAKNVYSGQNFASGSKKAYSMTFVASSNLPAGPYKFAVGVFTKNYGSNPYWNGNVEAFSVMGSSTATATATATSSSTGTSMGTATASNTSTATVTASSSSTSTSTSVGYVPNPNRICPDVAPGDYEWYRLSPVSSSIPGVSAAVDYAFAQPSGGWYGLQAMDYCRFQQDGMMTWHGSTAVRIEVDPGDDPLALGENTERTESYSFQTASGSPIVENGTGDQFYATSYYFDASWGGTFYPWHVFETGGSTWPGNYTSDCSAGSGNECNSWSAVLQFHAGSPPWGALNAARYTPGGPEIFNFGTSAATYAFSDGGAILANRWTDFVIEINWTNGAINIWRRNQGQTAFTQVVSVIDPSVTRQAGVYAKQGLYRGGNVNGRTDVFWIGPSARGSSFSAVENAAFGTNNGP